VIFQKLGALLAIPGSGTKDYSAPRGKGHAFSVFGVRNQDGRLGVRKSTTVKLLESLFLQYLMGNNQKTGNEMMQTWRC
jgi:hypothetical protein